MLVPYICENFIETYNRLLKTKPDLRNKFQAFLKFKEENPGGRFGGKDESFASDGIFNTHVPKLRHAHLTGDISIFYIISGSDPRIIKLYGVYTHDESGTGQPPNRKRQKSVVQTLSNAVFKPM